MLSDPAYELLELDEADLDEVAGGLKALWMDDQTPTK